MTRTIAAHCFTILFLLLTTDAFADPGPMKLWYAAPASKWTEALPIGNGHLGAMVFGGTSEASYQFNHDTLFSGEPHDYAHRGAVKFLPQLRELLFDGRQEEAHRLGNREFMSINTRGENRQEAYQPFGDLSLQFPGHENVKNYYRELDIDQAIASLRYQVDGVTYRRHVFASHADDAIIVRLEADQPSQISCIVSLSSPHADATTMPIGNNALVMSGQVEKGETRFQARVIVRTDGGKTTASDGRLSIASADAATLILVGASSFVNYRDISGDPDARNGHTLERIGDKSYASMRDAHVGDHQNLFRRVSLDLGLTDQAQLPTDQRLKRIGSEDPQLVALFFQYGRYLLIASSRPGSQPANLQGIWNESKTPPWESKWTININTEMNYWPAEMTNLAECHQPLLDALKDLAQTGAIVAREHYVSATATNCASWRRKKARLTTSDRHSRANHKSGHSSRPPLRRLAGELAGDVQLCGHCGPVIRFRVRAFLQTKIAQAANDDVDILAAEVCFQLSQESFEALCIDINITSFDIRFALHPDECHTLDFSAIRFLANLFHQGVVQFAGFCGFSPLLEVHALYHMEID